jgi:excisionase family DNA binding protein
MTERPHKKPMLARHGTTNRQHEALPFMLTVNDVAELLRTTPKAVYAMIDRGLLPGVTRVGRRLLIRRDDLLQWLNRNRAPSSKEA